MNESSSPHLPPEIASASEKLVRGMGLVQSTAVNMLEMIGIGPFITIGVIISAMGGPQAILGWFLGALFSICDGMVYAELGAAMPGAGGSYIYFREAFNPRTWGRLVLLSFSLGNDLRRSAGHFRRLRRVCGLHALRFSQLNSHRRRCGRCSAFAFSLPSFFIAPSKQLGGSPWSCLPSF